MIPFPTSSFLSGMAPGWTQFTSNDSQINTTETFLLFPKVLCLFLFCIFFSHLLCVWGWGRSLCFLWLFFSLLPPAPLCCLSLRCSSEPFLNAKANKRKNVSFYGWQDNKAQRVGSSLAASIREQALGTGAWIHPQQVHRAPKELALPNTFCLSNAAPYGWSHSVFL